MDDGIYLHMAEKCELTRLKFLPLLLLLAPLPSHAASMSNTAEAMPPTAAAQTEIQLPSDTPYRYSPEPGETQQTLIDPPAILDIEAAVTRAVESHPSVRQAVRVLEQTSENIDIAEAGYFPQVQGGFNTEYDQNMDRYNKRVVHKFQVSATQMLYDFGKVSSSVDQAEAASAAARARVLLAVDQVARETALAFIEVQRYNALEKIAEAQYKSVSALSDLVRERHRKGAGSLSDETQAQSRAESAQATLVEIQAQLQRWQSNLLYLTSMTSLADLKETIPAKFEGACSVGQPDWQLLPEALVAQAEREEALAALDEANAQTLPTLSLEGTAARALNAETYDNRQNDVTAMVNFSMPFYQGGALQAQKRAAANALSAAEEAINHIRLTASQNLAETLSQALGYEQRSGLLAERVESIELTRDLYKEQYLELGTRTLVDLLNAEQEYHQANITRANNHYDLERMRMDCSYYAGQMREAFSLNGSVVAGVELQP